MDMSRKTRMLLLPLICLTLLCSCNSGKEAKPESEIYYETGTYDWEIGEEVSVTDMCVPDKETAIQIGKAITAGFRKKGYFPDYVPQHVFFDTEKKVWIVTSWPENKNDKEIYNGACFSVAIRKDNGEVIKMWVGE